MLWQCESNDAIIFLSMGIDGATKDRKQAMAPID